MRFEFSSLIALVAAALAVAQASTEPLHDSSIVHSAGRVAPQTNAKRLAAGLPPLPPRTHHRSHSGTKVNSARRSAASPLPPVKDRCNILVKGDDGSTLGFISPTWNWLGLYTTVQADQAGALEVSVSYAHDVSELPSQLDFTAINGPNASFPFFGASISDSARSDLSLGSSNYAWLSGITRTSPGSPPVYDGDSSFGSALHVSVRKESAIWKYNPATQDIAAQWINMDGSAPATHLITFGDSAGFAITGDVDKLRSDYIGRPNFEEVTFTCVPPTAVPV